MKKEVTKIRNKFSEFSSSFDLGANRTGADSFHFKVWAPWCAAVTLKLLRSGGEELFAMERDNAGYYSVSVNNVQPGLLYSYVLDNGRERADPAARSLPVSPHGPAEIVDPLAYRWTDMKWKGIPLSDMVLYEAHIGTFTLEGTFAAAIEKIPYLKKLGITCLEILPVARFPGERNWGYDGTGLYAVQPSYGGPVGLKDLVNACHSHGLAVCLDVVYNHLGPEGNYLRDFGPYFTGKYHAPWGEAVNFDGEDCGPVRKFFVENACYWIREFHFDALRLDAVHAIYDFSARHILQDINAAVLAQGKTAGRAVHVFAESDLNDVRLISPVVKGGYGLAGQWSDDFHHAVHSLLTGERNGYYLDFGSIADLAKALTDGFVYDGKDSAFRCRPHGNSAKGIAPEKLVVSIQNHDQVGNRAWGERFGTLLSFSSQKLAASLLLLSPNTPLLFMGEEYGETAPFQYFIDHENPDLVRAVQEGRRRDFASFGWSDGPDPKSKDTFLNSKLVWSRIEEEPHRFMLCLYKDLLKLRRKVFGSSRKRARTFTSEEKRWLAIEYSLGDAKRYGALFSFFENDQIVRNPFKGSFTPVFSSEAKPYGGRARNSTTAGQRDVSLLSMSAVFGALA